MQSRCKASLLHLALSLTAVSLLVAVVLLLWYPAPYDTAMGITKILCVLASVDIVLGPLLTLIIFNPGKPTLKFDLAVIAMLQLAALAYGAVTAFAGRPVFVVFNLDRFTVVSEADIPANEMTRAGMLALPLHGPRIVAARLPEDKDAQAKILFSAVGGGADLAQMPEFYLPYAAAADEVRARLLTPERLLGQQTPVRRAQAQSLIAAVLRDNGLKPADVGYLPLRAKAQDMTVMVSRADARIVSMLPFDPWGS